MLSSTGTDARPAYGLDYGQNQLPPGQQPDDPLARRIPTTNQAHQKLAAAPQQIGGDMGSVTNPLVQQLSGASQGEPAGAAVAPQLGRATSQSAPTPDGHREQWSLGDLLARASEAEASAQPQPQPQLAEPGSAPEFQQRPTEPQAPTGQPGMAGGLRFQDLAGAIDHRTADEVWQRYRRGERTFFDRQLYTIEGRAAFDEISQRYVQNNDFRITIDHYMADFERLLRDAEAKDNDGRLILNHLTSETGRIYLILAHASGRLN